MDRDTRNKIIELLSAFLDNTGTRQALVNSALWGENWLGNIKWQGDANTFTSHLIDTAMKYDGTGAVIALLEEQQRQTGRNRQQEIQVLIDRLANGAAPAASTNPPPAQNNGGININVGGNINAGMMNMGGTQTFYGDTVINQGDGGVGPSATPTPTPKNSTLTPAAKPVPAAVRDQVFISYSHDDTDWMIQLKAALKPAINAGTIKVWTDEQIKPADDWRYEIDTALSKTCVAVMLISQNFIGSSFIMGTEYPILMEWVKQGHVKLIWIPIAKSQWKQFAPELGDYQAVGSPDKPLNRLSQEDLEDMWIDIAIAIQAVFDEAFG